MCVMLAIMVGYPPALLPCSFFSVKVFQPVWVPGKVLLAAMLECAAEDCAVSSSTSGNKINDRDKGLCFTALFAIAICPYSNGVHGNFSVQVEACKLVRIDAGWLAHQAGPAAAGSAAV